jgi:hypothetical protein
MTTDRTREDISEHADVIEVEAEAIDAVASDNGFSRDADTAKVRKNRTWALPGVAAALVTGLVGGGWLYRDVLATYFPNDKLTTLTSQLNAIETRDKTLADQVVNLSRLADQLKADVDAIESGLQDLKTETAKLGTITKDSSLKQQQLEIAVQGAAKSIGELQSATTSVAAPITGEIAANPSALAGLATRLDNVEKDVTALKSQKTDTTDTTALTQSLADLKAKAAAGQGFAEELDRIRRMVPAAEGLDALTSASAAGLANAQGLAKELADALSTLPSSDPAATTSADDSLWGRFTSMFSGLITIRDAGSSDWQRIGAELVAYAEAGDLLQAVKRVDAIDGSKPGAIQSFRDRAAQRLDLDDALTKTSDAVLRHIAARAGN